MTFRSLTLLFPSLAVLVAATACQKPTPDQQQAQTENDLSSTSASGCGTERWAIKTGTDPLAASVTAIPTDTTIATLVGYPVPTPAPSTTRVAPQETTRWRLVNVTLTGFKSESDSDFHLVISDGQRTMIAEIPAPSCVSGGPFAADIATARAVFLAKHAPGSFTSASDVVTLTGVGFFDRPHGQTGVAPNAIELHPVLHICFGTDCDSAGPAPRDAGRDSSPRMP